MLLMLFASPIKVTLHCKYTNNILYIQTNNKQNTNKRKSFRNCLQKMHKINHLCNKITIKCK